MYTHTVFRYIYIYNIYIYNMIIQYGGFPKSHGDTPRYHPKIVHFRTLENMDPGERAQLPAAIDR